MDDRGCASSSRSQTSRLWRTSSSFERQQQRLQSRANADAAAAEPAAAASRRAVPAAGHSPATSAATAMLMAIAAQLQSCNLGSAPTGSSGSGELTPPGRSAAAEVAAVAAADCLPSRSVAHTSAGGVAGLGGDLQAQLLWHAYQQKQASMQAAAAATAAGSAHEAAAATPAAHLTAANHASPARGTAVDSASCSLGDIKEGAHRVDSPSRYDGGGRLRVLLPKGHSLRRIVMTTIVTAVDEQGKEKEFR